VDGDTAVESSLGLLVAFVDGVWIKDVDSSEEEGDEEEEEEEEEDNELAWFILHNLEWNDFLFERATAGLEILWDTARLPLI